MGWAEYTQSIRDNEGVCVCVCVDSIEFNERMAPGPALIPDSQFSSAY